MRTLIALIISSLPFQAAHSETIWCQDEDPDSTQLCDVNFARSKIDCGFLDGDYRITFSSGKSISFTNRCDESGEILGVDYNDQFANSLTYVELNNNRYFYKYFVDGTGNTILWEGFKSKRESRYPPWSPVALQNGIPGECYIYAGEISKRLCAETIVCETSLESFEGGCTRNYKFADGSALTITNNEDWFSLDGFDFSWSDVVNSRRETCYPTNPSGGKFCFKK